MDKAETMLLESAALSMLLVFSPAVVFTFGLPLWTIAVVVAVYIVALVIVIRAGSK